MSRITHVTPTRGLAPSHAPPDMTFAPGQGLSHALGWFSIGLGVVELVAPHRVGKWTGVDRPALIQLYGLREVVTGITVLSCSRPSAGMWARVAGDVLDLGTLSTAMANPNPEIRRRATAAAVAVGGVSVLDLFAASELSAAKRMEG